MRNQRDEKVLMEGMKAASEKVSVFFEKAFSDMRASAKAQHEVDKANFNAAKAESRAQWEEAKAMGSPRKHKEKLAAKREADLADAKHRQEEARARIEKAKQ